MPILVRRMDSVDVTRGSEKRCSKSNASQPEAAKQQHPPTYPRTYPMSARKVLALVHAFGVRSSAEECSDILLRQDISDCSQWFVQGSGPADIHRSYPVLLILLCHQPRQYLAKFTRVAIAIFIYHLGGGRRLIPTSEPTLPAGNKYRLEFALDFLHYLMSPSTFE